MVIVPVISSLLVAIGLGVLSAKVKEDHTAFSLACGSLFVGICFLALLGNLMFH